MAKHPEHEEKNVLSEGRKSSDNKADDDGTNPSKATIARLKLKLITKHAIRGFAPVAAVLALIIAVVSSAGNRSSQEQLSKAAARLDGVSASLSATRGELEKLKAATAQEKAMQEERVTKIIQSVNQLQLIMHVSPTLEEELLQSARTPAASPSAASAATEAVTTGGGRKPGAR